MFFLKWQKAFSIIELLTAVSIVGVLSIVGIKSYQSQIHKARTTEAKTSLAYIWSAQDAFHDTWGTYFGNLIVTGAIPSGNYYYDVGFTTGEHANLTSTADQRTNSESKLSIFPLPAILAVNECVTFYDICKGTCLSRTKDVAGDDAKSYFTVSSATDSHHAEATCTVVGCTADGSTKTCLKDKPSYPVDGGTFKAETGINSFDAAAAGNLKKEDVWSIDEKKVITHQVDGTE